MYFQKFPSIYYGFPNADSSDIFVQILTDITTNIRFRKQILENVTLYDEYDIKEGETVEIIAEKVYGNPEYHWIIMLLNERYDYVKDFPLTEVELNNYIDETYGEDRYGVHHYEKNGIIVEAKANVKVRYYEDQPLINAALTGDILIGKNSQARGIVIAKSLEENTITVQLDSIPFVENEELALFGARLNEELDAYEYGQILINATITASTNACTYTETYDIVTNEIYEIRKNEAKRRIKLISPTLLSQILTEFEAIL